MARINRGPLGSKVLRMLALMAVALLLMPTTATARPSTAYKRHLLEDSFPVCGKTAGCTSSCNLCPAEYQCTNAPGKPTCTNVFGTAPVLGKGTVTIDSALCDWAGTSATFLGPMYTGGDCTKGRLGGLYALYDCSSSKVCFKATSCVGNVSSKGPNGFSTTDPKYACPGVGCGCYNTSQAANESSEGGDTLGDNWFILAQSCSTSSSSKTGENIPTGYTQGLKSGWEYCYSAAPNTLYTIQAHFDSHGNTLDAQKPNSDPYFLQFKTPSCACNSVTKPSTCQASATTATPITCTAGSQATVFPTNCFVSGTTYSYTNTGTSISISSTGSFTCPATGGATAVTVTAKDGSVACYSFLVQVTSGSSPITTPCGVVTPPAAPTTCANAAQASATFTVSTSSPSNTITKTCPDGTSTTISATSGQQQVQLTCPIPQTSAGWSSGAFQVALSGSACVVASGQIQPQVLPVSSVTVAPANMDDPAPAICTGDTTATAYFEVTLSDSSAQPAYTVGSGCTYTSQGSGVMRVTCTSSATSGYTSSTVSISLSVSATSTTTCPTPGSLSQSIAVRPTPVLQLAAVASSTCASGTTVTAQFSYQGSTVADPAVGDLSVAALALNGGAVSGVSCSNSGVNIDPTTKTISVICTLGSGMFQGSDLDFSSIRLTFNGKDSCGKAVATATATAAVSVTLAPYLHFGAVNAPTSVCASAATVTAGFPYTAKHGTVTSDNFAVTGAGCTKQMITGSPSQISITCPTSVAAQGVTVSGTLAAASPCPSSASASDSASVTVPADPVPVLASITATGTTICAAESQATVSFDFSNSQYMAPLTTGHFSVQPLNSTGAAATGVTCGSTVSGQTITVQCTTAGNVPFSTLGGASAFASVQLTVNSITGVGACSNGQFNPSPAVTSSAIVTIAPQPQLTSITATGTTICAAESQATVSFDFSNSQYMAPLTTGQFSVQPLNSTGAAATGVTCGSTVSPANIILVQCGLADNEPFSTLSSPGDFASVQLTVNSIVGVGPCANQAFHPAATFSAAVTLQPQPQLHVSPSGPTTVCDSEFSVAVRYDFSGSQYMEPLTTNQITVKPLSAAQADAVGVTCTPTVSAQDELITVQCTPASNAAFSSLSPGAFASVDLTVNSVTGLGACAQEYFHPAETYRAAVTIVPQAQLSISSPSNSSVCYGVATVSAAFDYSVKAQTSLSFTTASGCTLNNGTVANQVVVTCPAPTDYSGTQAVAVPVGLQAVAGSTAPCAGIVKHELATVWVDTIPSVTLQLQQGQPKSACCAGPLQAVFDYSIVSNVGGNALVDATMPGASCVTAGGPPKVLNSDVTSGSMTVTCSGTFSPGSTPALKLIMTVNKRSCSHQETTNATAVFSPLCCCFQGTSYAALVDSKGIRKTCFEKGSTCIYKNITKDVDTKTKNSTKDSKASSTKVAGVATADASKVRSKTIVKDDTKVIVKNITKDKPAPKCFEKYSNWGFYVRHVDTEIKATDTKVVDSKKPLAGKSIDSKTVASTAGSKLADSKTVSDKDSKDSKVITKVADRVLLIAGSDSDCTSYADCASGTVVGDAFLTCKSDEAGKPIAVIITVNNLPGSQIDEQNFYIGCKAITACSAPTFGAASSTSGCSIGAADSCGGTFPSSTTLATASNGMKSQTFTIAIDPKRVVKSKCLSCMDIVWVIRQSGTYMASPGSGFCTAAVV